MATTLHEPLTDGGMPRAPLPLLSNLVPWGRLVSGLAAIPAVTTLGVVTARGSIDLWVVMSDEDDEAEAEVSRLEREFRIAIGPAPFELHVAPLTMVSPANLPPFETIFSR